MTSLRAANDSSKGIFLSGRNRSPRLRLDVPLRLIDEVAHGGPDEHDGHLPLLMLVVLVLLL